MDAFDPVLCLPVRGHLVRIPSPTAREGLRLHRLLADPGALTREVERAEGMRLVAPALPQLDALGADRTVVGLVATTALLHYGRGAESGADYWNGELGADPEPQAPADPLAPGYLGPDDPGGGPVDPVSGLRRWYNPPAAVAAPLPVVHWADVLAHWDQVSLDLHDRWQIDTGGPVLDERPWHWLEIRIRDLVSTPGTRTHTALSPTTTTA